MPARRIQQVAYGWKSRCTVIDPGRRPTAGKRSPVTLNCATLCNLVPDAVSAAHADYPTYPIIYKHLRKKGPTRCRALFMGAEGFEPPTPWV